MGEQGTRVRSEECSLLGLRKHLLIPVRRQNPTSSSWQRQGWPTFLVEVAPVVEVVEFGVVAAGAEVRGKEMILGEWWSWVQVPGSKVVQG